jgi:hypothetical protein
MAQAQTTIRFRNDEQFWKYMALKDIRDQAGLAKAIGVDRATVTRTLKGGSLGIVFVSQLLAAFHPDLAFEDFFDIVPIPEQRTGDGVEDKVPAA